MWKFILSRFLHTNDHVGFHRKCVSEECFPYWFFFFPYKQCWHSGEKKKNQPTNTTEENIVKKRCPSLSHPSASQFPSLEALLPVSFFWDGLYNLEAYSHFMHKGWHILCDSIPCFFHSLDFCNFIHTTENFLNGLWQIKKNFLDRKIE